jgi:16S rRNA processing protein RimM
MINKIYIGKITGIFGIHGEIKCQIETNHQEEVIKIGSNIYIENNKYIISSIKYHQKTIILGLKAYDSIEKIEPLIKKEIYINRDEYPNIDYFVDELFNLDILDEKEKKIGIVKEVLYNKNNLLIKDGSLIIPVINKFIIEINVKKGYIKTCDTKELR